MSQRGNHQSKGSHVEAGLIARATKKLSTLEVAKPCDSATLKISSGKISQG